MTRYATHTHHRDTSNAVATYKRLQKDQANLRSAVAQGSGRGAVCRRALWVVAVYLYMLWTDGGIGFGFHCF